MKMLRREAAAVLLLLVGATAVAARPFRLRHLLGFAGPRVAAPKKVSVLGLGLLGSAIAERLLDLGWEVTLWNRTPAKAAALSRRPNARLAGSAADAANGADLILTCVTDGSALEAILFGSEGVAAAWGTRPAALDGRLVVDMSTIAPGEARDFAMRLESECAAALLDAPISGGVPAARRGSMTVMVGGEANAFAQAQPLMDALAARATLLGGSGAGQSAKMINQVLVGANFALLAEACALAERAGVDVARLPEALAGGRADSRLLQEYLPRMAAREFTPRGKHSIMLKDLNLAANLAAQVGLPSMPMADTARSLHEKLVARGLGEDDNAAFVKLYLDGNDRTE